jgi:hypothetical protein
VHRAERCPNSPIKLTLNSGQVCHTCAAVVLKEVWLTSLMRRYGARLEVARDNMGHAGSTGSITLDVYSKTWWTERVEAVSRVVEAVFAEPDEEEKKTVIPQKGLPDRGDGKEWEPFWESQAVLPEHKSV